jgi:integrating conjugative element membrane protein (TIGR03745 family)
MTLSSHARRVLAGITGGLIASRRVVAQSLPDVTTPDGADEGDFISILEALASQGLTVIIFVVGAAAFLLVGWSVIAKFNECRSGRAEWSEAAVTAGIGAVILVFSTFLLTQANSIFGDA